MREGHAIREAGARDRAVRAAKHFRRSVQPKKPDIRITTRDVHQIARRAAPDLDEARARRQSKLADRAVSAKEVVPARDVINEPLSAIDAIHQSSVLVRAWLHDREANVAHRYESRHRSR